MKCFVVLSTSGEDTEVLYCGTGIEIAEEILYKGKRANRSMKIWENGEYVTTKWGNHK